MGESGEVKKSSNINNTGVLWGRRNTDGLMLRRTGSEKIITYKGNQGLFTPLTTAEKEDESRYNLEKIVEVLREEVVMSKQENLELKDKLKKALVKPSRTPDDFATAVSHSLDTLQTRLAQMSNSVSNFAIREFTIETNVHIDVTPLGTIDYRFVQPEDNIAPEKLSKLKMTLSPIPKPTAQGVRSRSDFTPLHDIDDIQGIGEAYRKRLNNHQIYTVSDLISAGSRVRSKVELESLLEVDRDRLSEWISHAELMTIKDIDGRSAEVLYNIGINNLKQLSAKSAEDLAKQYNAEIKKVGHSTLKPITAEKAAPWIKAAQAYTGFKNA